MIITMQAKEILTVIAIILMFASYIPYTLDLIKGKTQPHIYTWLVWTILSATTAGLY